MDSKTWVNVLFAGLPGVIIAVFLPLFFDRRAAWREARRSLLLDFKQLYDSLETISRNPHKFNRFTFKFLFLSEASVIKHYAKSFCTKRRKLEKLAEMTRTIPSDLLLIDDYEELLLKTGESSGRYQEFLTEIQHRIHLLNVLLLNLGCI